MIGNGATQTNFISNIRFNVRILYDQSLIITCDIHHCAIGYLVYNYCNSKKASIIKAHDTFMYTHV